MDKEYGVIHEIGDYYKPKKLSDEDNRAVNEQLNEEKKDKKENK
jgi:hypothetical protein